MKLFVLLFIGFIGLEARDNKPSGDPAPGRSGPPSKSRETFDEIETSHEAYRPAVEHEMSTTTNNQKAFSDIFSSMSSENVEYRDIIHYNNHEEEFSDENTNSEKLIIDIRSETELKDNDGASSAFKQSAPLTLQPPNAKSRLELDNNSSTHSKHSKSTSLEIINSHQDRCDLGTPSPRIARYLKLGDRVIEMDFNYSKEHENVLTRPKENTKNHRMRVDVSHDVFETASRQSGLLMGIIYKGKNIQCHRKF